MNHKPLTPAELAELSAGLHRLSRNLWWTWNQEPQEIFYDLSPRGWTNLYHNAVAILHEVSDYELKMRLQEPEFADRVRTVLKNFDAYLANKDTWCAQNAPELLKNPVAYFSAEFGFHETLPIAAGGLGMLAGDHAKAASDLGLGFVGITLFYREGYFQQTVNADNWQTEFYSQLKPQNLPIEPVLNANGDPLVCTVKVAASTVSFKAWRCNVGRCPVYLLDANLPENEPHQRDLTLRVYGGDTTTRVMQEILLGVGGVRLLRELGLQPSTFHMNEGHAAFLTLELAREKMAEGKPFAQAWAETKQQCLFTTHTPVEAGHDRFSSDLMSFAANKFGASLKLTHQELMGLGRVNPADKEEPFCMTVLALKGSRAANGVSELHGAVSREMWQCLYPGKTVEEVPIGHVTNGIHVAGWMKGTVRRFWRNKLSAAHANPDTSTSETTRFWKSKPSIDWEREINEPEFWSRMADPAFISDEELWSLRYRLRRELIEFSRRRLLLQGQRLSQSDFITFDHMLNPDALTIGFARRFATYKRAPLVFQQFENYDVHVARQMVSGCDVWLNNPRRPLEASGTSGMKCGCHGCLNMSIMDGWWREGYDGHNGFSIGDDSHPASIEEQDLRDSENTYKVLTEEVIPCFYNRDAGGIPRQWLGKVRRAMTTLVPQFSTWRMVQEYTRKYYQAK